MMKNLNVAQIAEIIAPELELSKKRTKLVIDTFFDAVAEQLSQWQWVSIFWFGIFSIKKYTREFFLENFKGNRDIKSIRFKPASGLKNKMK